MFDFLKRKKKNSNSQGVLSSDDIEDKIKKLDACQFEILQKCSSKTLNDIKDFLRRNNEENFLSKTINKEGSIAWAELIILSCVLTGAFMDTDGRGYLKDNESNELSNGKIRLCQILCKENIEESDFVYLNNRVSFYKDELDYLKQAKYPLPIEIMYPIFYSSQESMDHTKSIREINPFMCVKIWSIIYNNISKVVLQ